MSAEDTKLRPSSNVAVQSEDIDVRDTAPVVSHVYPELDLNLWRPVVPESPNDEEGQFFRSVVR
jgi:hypothetical protein